MFGRNSVFNTIYICEDFLIVYIYLQNTADEHITKAEVIFLLEKPET